MILLPFPAIDPVVFHLGPWPVRWYGVAYAAGILLAWGYLRHQLKHYPTNLRAHFLEEFIVPLIIGIVIGGRLGYVFLYHPSHYLAHPLEIFMVWQGGMAFHGGLLGAIAGMAWLARRNALPMLALTDVIALGAPVGLFLGRLANFINAEHFGHVTNVPWGVIFPTGGPSPRHPSQLYEAITEGLILGIILYFAWLKPSWRSHGGRISGLFLTGYGVARIFCEFFRVPDGMISLLSLPVTTGQLLSIPMLLLGLYLIYGPSPRTITQ